MTGIKKQYARVSIDDLTVDLRVQRGKVDPAHVRRIARNFDPLALGVITISVRPDGSKVILDGLHRVSAARLLGYTEKIPAIVYEGLTVGEEASLFLTQNDAKPVSTLDKFLVRVTEGDPAAVAVAAAVQSHGWTIRPGQSHGCLSSVAAIEKAYNGAGITPGPRLDVVHRVLEIVTDAWGHDAKAVNGVLLGGLAQLLLRYDYDINVKKLTADLEKTTPLRLIGNARTLADGQKMPAASAMGMVLHGVYNNNLRSRRLPNWTRS